MSMFAETRLWSDLKPILCLLLTRYNRIEKVVRDEEVIQSTEDRWFLVRVPSKLF